MTSSGQRIVIIGNGIAGVTAARYIRKYSDHEITIISAESKYFWSRTALMYIYMGHMTYEHTKPYEDHFWEANRISLIHDYVKQVDTARHCILLAEGEELHYDSLVLATGSLPNRFDWPGQELTGVTGMVSLQDLERIETLTRETQHAVVVGGGLIGVELAEMLRSREIEVTFLIRESHFWANVLPEQESGLISAHLHKHGVRQAFSTELREILASEDGKVRAVLTSRDEEIPCTFVGLAAGVSPNISMAAASGIPVNRGILVNEFLETEIPDIYAIGDCAERKKPLPGRKPIEQVWYTGRMMGETLALTLTGKRQAYDPGPWFNSAKFFDIEYQTYGQVPPEIPDEFHDLYWHEGERALHLVFENGTGKFTGINAFGIRLRHEWFDRWLRRETHIREVMSRLPEASFDPEFFNRPFQSVIDSFNRQYPDYAVEFKRKKILGIF